MSDHGLAQRALSVVGPAALSGVRVWSERMAQRRRGRWEWRVHSLRDGASTTPLEHARELAGVIRDLRVRVVVPNDQPAAFLAATLEHHRGVRCAAIVHGDDLRYEELFERCGLLADSWAAVSARSRRRAAAFVTSGTPGFAPLPCGVDVPAEPTPCRPRRVGDDPLRLLYPGRLDHAFKRSRDLVRLADALTDLGLPFTLTIAGDGPIRGDLERAARSHIAAGRVTLRGAVPPGDMPRMHAEHDMLVMVSGSEGWPIAVMEAMAAGRPAAITTGCGGAAEVIRDGVDGLIAPVGDMPALARRIAGSARAAGALACLGREAHAAARVHLDLTALAPRHDAWLEAAASAPSAVEPARPASILERWDCIRSALDALGVEDEASIAAVAREWSGGVPAAGLSLPVQPLRRPSIPARRFAAALERTRSGGAERIAVYGAGRHTRALGVVLADAPSVVAIVDDAPRPGATLFGRPIVTPDRLRGLRVDACIVSSDEYEQVMWERASGWRDPPLIVRLYADVFAPDASP